MKKLYRLYGMNDTDRWAPVYVVGSRFPLKGFEGLIIHRQIIWSRKWKRFLVDHSQGSRLVISEESTGFQVGYRHGYETVAQFKARVIKMLNDKGPANFQEAIDKALARQKEENR